jgi:outer membrane protein
MIFAALLLALGLQDPGALTVDGRADPGFRQERAPAGRCVTLPETIDAALDIAPRLGIAEAEREAARARVLAARSRSLPQISSFGTLGLGDTLPIDQVRDDQAGFRANWDLFTFGQQQAAMEEARQTLRAAQAGELQAQTEIAEETILLYYELLRMSKMRALTEAQVTGYSQEADTVSRRLERGLVTRSDARQIEARFASAEASLELASLRADEAAMELSVLTGLNVTCVEEPSAVRLGEALAMVLGTLEPSEAYMLAEDNAFFLAQAKSQVRAAEARYRGARRAGLPTISLNAFVIGVYDDGDLAVGDRWSRDDRVGFAFRQDFYTGGRLRADRLESRARLRSASAEFEAQRRQLELAVRTAVLGVQRQGAVQTRRAAATDAAKERLDTTILELDRGTKTITDFVLANEDYYRTALDEVGTLWARDQALVRLASLTGVLLNVDPAATRDMDVEIRVLE